MVVEIKRGKAVKGMAKWQGTAILKDCLALAKTNGGKLQMVNKGKFDNEPVIENGTVYGGASKLDSLAKYLSKVNA